jgi:hypothetical protein
VRRPLLALAAALALGAAPALLAQDKEPAKEEKPGKTEKAEKPAEKWLPKADDFTKALLEIVKSYPTDGTHKYHWPRQGSWPGTTRDLFYAGEKVCEGDPEKRCYCCGLTFEVFFRAWEKCCEDAKRPFKILSLDPKGVTDLRHEWFGPTEKDRTTLQKAITRFELGKKIDLKDARAGDFCQFWRRSGNGHSVILLEVQKDDAGSPTALRYWSTQSSTNGVHENTEKFGTQKAGVIVEETYVARVGG